MNEQQAPIGFIRLPVKPGSKRPYESDDPRVVTTVCFQVREIVGYHVLGDGTVGILGWEINLTEAEIVEKIDWALPASRRLW